MMRTAFLLLFVLMTAMFAAAQGHPHYQLEVNCAESMNIAAGTAEFEAVIRPKVDESKRVRYEWTVSAGQILEGQNTPKIKLDISSEMPGSLISATVRVPGEGFYFMDLSGSCGTTILSSPKVIDEMERPNCERLQAAMDLAGAEMANSPSHRLFAVVYPARSGSQRGEHFAVQIGAWVRMRRFDPERITIAFGAVREAPAVTLYAVSPGEEEPITERRWTRRSAFAGELIPKRAKLVVTETVDENPCFSDESALQDLGLFLKENPGARARVVIKVAAARDFREQARTLKETLNSDYGIAPARVAVVHTRSRPWPKGPMRTIEYWLLPSAGKAGTSRPGTTRDIGYVRLIEIFRKIEQLSKQISGGADSWDARMERAKLYIESSQLRPAEADLTFAKSIGEHPYNVAMATLQRARVRGRLRDLAGQEADYSAIVSIEGAKPYWGQAYSERASLFHGQGRHGLGLADADSAIKFYASTGSSRRKQLGAAYSIRSDIHCAMGNIKQASEDRARARAMGASVMTCKTK